MGFVQIKPTSIRGRRVLPEFIILNTTRIQCIEVFDDELYVYCDGYDEPIVCKDMDYRELSIGMLTSEIINEETVTCG